MPHHPWLSTNVTKLKNQYRDLRRSRRSRRSRGGAVYSTCHWFETPLRTTKPWLEQVGERNHQVYIQILSPLLNLRWPKVWDGMVNGELCMCTHKERERERRQWPSFPPPKQPEPKELESTNTELVITSAYERLQTIVLSMDCTLLLGLRLPLLLPKRWLVNEHVVSLRK